MEWSSTIKREQEVSYCSVTIYVKFYNKFDAKLPLKPKVKFSFSFRASCFSKDKCGKVDVINIFIYFVLVDHFLLFIVIF